MSKTDDMMSVVIIIKDYTDVTLMCKIYVFDATDICFK